MYQLYNSCGIHLWYRGLVLSCQIQDNLSLYYNMVVASGKMGPKNARKLVQNTRKVQYKSTPATSDGLITQSL